MNDHEMSRIADAMHHLRPDWPASSIRTLLSKPELATRGRRDVTVALAWVACDANTHSPARVLEVGPWWKAAGVEGTLTRRHPDPSSACHTCGKDLSGSCCDAPSKRPAPSSDYSTHASTARAALRGTP